MPSEDELIIRCRRGETAAWDQLFDRYYTLTARFIAQLSFALVPDDVEEISQEVFLSVIRNLHTFQGNSSFPTWLYRIAANKTRDFLQKQSAAKRGGGETIYSLDNGHPESGLKIDPPSSNPAPDRMLAAKEEMLLIRAALDELGDPCREIIELRYFGDLGYEELATALNLNVKTVSSRLSKCLDKLEALARPRFQRENIGVPSV